MPKDVILTPEGLEKLQRELDDLQTNKRREVAERIKEAREFGAISTDLVRVGVTVNVKDEKTGDTDKYTIVGSAEANPSQKKLSNESPVGKALLGHKRNDTVDVALPNGRKRKLKITKIDVA
jgi:transcription elongation factor GreA